VPSSSQMPKVQASSPQKQPAKLGSHSASEVQDAPHAPPGTPPLLAEPDTIMLSASPWFLTKVLQSATPPWTCTTLVAPVELFKQIAVVGVISPPT
jgi:hypothetical protein